MPVWILSKNDENCWTLYPERGRKHLAAARLALRHLVEIVGLFTLRGDGNRLAIGHKGVGRERVV